MMLEFVLFSCDEIKFSWFADGSGSHCSNRVNIVVTEIRLDVLIFGTFPSPHCVFAECIGGALSRRGLAQHLEQLSGQASL